MDTEERKRFGMRLMRQSANFRAVALLVAAVAGAINGVYTLAALLAAGAAALFLWARFA